MVSHLIPQKEERIELFAEIDKRLALHKSAGIDLNRDHPGRDVAVLPTQDIEAIFIASRFSRPVLFYQALLAHAWYSKVG